MVLRRDCTPINFNFCTWYKVEIRFSDNTQQKETIEDIIWPRRKKCHLHIRYHFQYNPCGLINSVKNQLLAKGYLQISVEGYPKRDTKLHTCKEVECGNDLLFLCGTWSRCHEKLQFMLTGMHQNSILRSQDFLKEILSDLVHKDGAKFNVSFFISSMQLWKCLRLH